MNKLSKETINRRKGVMGLILVDNPGVAHLTAAKLLTREHPMLFPSVEVARSCLRGYTGNKGKLARDSKDPHGGQFRRPPFSAVSAAAPAAQREAEEARRQLKLANEDVAVLQETVRQFGAARRKYSLEPGSVGNTLRFAVIGDTHWGSLYERLDAFLAFMRMCEREKIREVYHCGDVLDGHGIYKGQAFEQYANGAAKQLEVFADKVPRFKGVQVYFITGNHDLSYKKLVGMDIGRAIEDLNPDWHYLGEDSALVKMKTQNGRTFNLSLVHPGGGSAYALSYYLQKHVEALSGGQKPDCVFLGHYHKSLWLPAYRNVESFLCGTFQSQTPFMAGRNLAAMLGGWVVESTVMPRESLSRSIKAEFHSFFEPVG